MALTRRQREILDFVAEFIRTRRYSPSLEEIAEHFNLSSVATVHKHVSNLERKGFIKRAWNRSRSIDLLTTDLPGLGPANVLTFGESSGPSRGRERGGGRGSGRASLVRGGEGLLPVALTGAIESLQGGYQSEEDVDGDVRQLPLAGRVAAGRPIEAIVDRETVSVPAPMIGRGRSYVLQVKGNSMIGEHIQDGDFVIVEDRQEARDGEKVIALLGDGEATLKTYKRQADGTVLLQPANPEFETLRVREGSFRIRGVVIGVMRKYRR